jgi:CubicO group peptidase (beta-lactamase class C family)
VGILEQRDVLDLGRPVDAVIGDLAGSGWAGVPIADVLSMASGIDCPDDNTPGACTDPGHPLYRFEACLGWRPAGKDPLPSPYEYVAGLKSHRRPAKPTSTQRQHLRPVLAYRAGNRATLRRGPRP